MPLTVSDLMLSGAKVLYAPYNTTLPADSLAVGAAWPSGWIDIGFTSQELTVEYTWEELPADEQQAMSPVKYARIDENAYLETVMSEITMANLAIAFGATAPTITPAAVGQVGKEVLKVGGLTNIPQFAWGFEGSQADAGGVLRPHRFVMYKGQASKGGQLKYNHKAWAGIPLKINGVADTTKSLGQQLFEYTRVTADALAA